MRFIIIQTMLPFEKNAFLAISAISIIAIILSYKINIYLFCVVICFVFVFYVWYINKITTLKSSFIAQEQEENTTTFKPQKSNITFKDIAGMQDIKDEFLDIIAMFKKKNKYTKLGIQPPKGVLLVGEPGVGKTMLARALSNECNISFFYQSGSSFANMYVGSGANSIKSLFTQAKKYSPCIIFIDEIDALGKSRGNGRNDERESTLNELLVQLDGFDNSGDIMVLGATNKIEIMDKALIRSGRFDKKIFIPLPTKDKRKQIIKFYLDRYPNKVDINMLVDMSIGQSGADISTMINNASLMAFKDNSSKILNKHFYTKHTSAISKYTDENKSILALYVSAKFFMGVKLGIDMPNKIFIFTNDFFDYSYEMASKSYLENVIQALLSGIVAVEEIHKDSYYLFKSDLSKSLEIAQQIVSMGVDKTSIDIVKELKKKTKKMIKKDKILRFRDILLQKEELNKKDISK